MLRATLTLAFVLAFGPATPALAQPGDAARLATLGERLVEGELDAFPAREAFTFGAGPRLNRAPRDLSPGFRERQRQLYAAILADLEAVDRATLAPDDAVNYDLLRLGVSSRRALAQYPLQEIELLATGWGVVGGLVSIAVGAQPLSTESDFEAWAQRLEASSVMLGQVPARLREAEAEGWTTSRPLVEKTLAQIDRLATTELTQSPFWGVLKRYPMSASTERRVAFEKRYRAVLEDKLFPALNALRRFVREEYLPKTRTTSGIGSLPKGGQAYRALIRHHTTLDLSAEEVHDLGLAEVKRIRAELLATARALGYTGEIAGLAAWRRTQAASYPFKEPEEVVAYLKRIHARVEPQMTVLFSRLPKAAFDIRLTDPAIAASASATYSRPLPDGSRPGVFRVPVRNAREYSSAGLTALLLHEGMPGHHLDIGRSIELDLPRFRKMNGITVYSEGWGLYAESLGHDLGVYDDKWALLGRYAAELHRAARLVVDTGLHAKGWSREEAIRYLTHECGEAEGGATVAIERYMSSPGQALAYKIGELEILKLKGEARARLGANFDVREFHEAVLSGGALSLELLRERVRTWTTKAETHTKHAAAAPAMMPGAWNPGSWAARVHAPMPMGGAFDPDLGGCTCGR